MTVRAAVVVTGTEVLTGRVSDRNGPWLAEQLRQIGVDIAEIVVVGDRPADLLAALEFVASAGADLIVTSGGLGPTADDLTAGVVARFQGRASTLDLNLQTRIAAIIERLSALRSTQFDPVTTAEAVRKQAMVPDDSEVLAPVGTAPGLVVTDAGGVHPPVVVLPGPPRELQGMWPAALATEPIRAVLAHASQIRQRTMRLWGTTEAELAAVLREYDAELDGLEITTCLRHGELEIVTRFLPTFADRYDRFSRLIARTYPQTLFSPEGVSIDDIVASRLLSHGYSVATAESCTGGMVAARLTDRPGSSGYVLGGLVTYSNQAKQELLGVPPELLASVGAVSEEVAVAMATGARRRLGADVGVSTTGIAGPGGGSADKPVGLVHLCASTETLTLHRRIVVPGSRADVRSYTVAVAMHLLRTVLS